MNERLGRHSHAERGNEFIRDCPYLSFLGSAWNAYLRIDVVNLREFVGATLVLAQFCSPKRISSRRGLGTTRGAPTGRLLFRKLSRSHALRGNAHRPGLRFATSGLPAMQKIRRTPSPPLKTHHHIF